ncbi:MAG: YeeE/YedE family protein [Myxococcales bacterium]|nr:YeeE/YedE family protein [Myxococcales bacterium]
MGDGKALDIAAVVLPIVGGGLIGLASAMMLLLHGRITGISGIIYGVLIGPREGWRVMFLLGLLAGGAMMFQWRPSNFAMASSGGVVVVAGLLVGLGTRIGSGCTSGHGVCGVGRLSPRSMVATLVFTAVGMVVASLSQEFGGGA